VEADVTHEFFSRSLTEVNTPRAMTSRWIFANATFTENCALAHPWLNGRVQGGTNRQGFLPALMHKCVASHLKSSPSRFIRFRRLCSTLCNSEEVETSKTSATAKYNCLFIFVVPGCSRAHLPECTRFLTCRISWASFVKLAFFFPSVSTLGGNHPSSAAILIRSFSENSKARFLFPRKRFRRLTRVFLTCSG